MDNTVVGYGNELIVAQAIIDESPEAYFPTDPSQVRLHDERLKKFKQLTPELCTKLQQAAFQCASVLPVAVGPVNFVESCVNAGEVYDVYYWDKSKQLVKVSCKTGAMEDKAYRFSTKGNRLVTIDDYNRTIFTDVGQSYMENILAAGLSKEEYFQNLLDMLVGLVRDDDPTLLVLTRDSFIGCGEYYKTTADGKVRYYAGVPEGSTISFSQEREPFITGTTCVYYVVVDVGHVEYEYEIRFRVKFKDGVNKPVKLAADGAVGNIAATVAIKNLSIDPFVTMREERRKVLPTC